MTFLKERIFLPSLFVNLTEDVLCFRNEKRLRREEKRVPGGVVEHPVITGLNYTLLINGPRNLFT